MKIKGKKEDGTEEAVDLTVENATTFLKESGLEVVDPKEEDIKDLAEYRENKEGYEAWRTEKEEALAKKRKELVENSDLEEDDVKDLSENVIDSMLTTLKVTVDNSARPGGGSPTTEEGGKEETPDSIKEARENSESGKSGKEE